LKDFAYAKNAIMPKMNCQIRENIHPILIVFEGYKSHKRKEGKEKKIRKNGKMKKLKKNAEINI
jgi:hypothetical protein